MAGGTLKTSTLATTLAATLLVETRFLQMRFLDSGRLLPWLGPALRGTVARHLKNRVCFWPPAEREARWKCCKGCPKQPDCPYGITFETAPAPSAANRSGMNDGQRAVALAPYFPVESPAHDGDTVQVRLTLVGRRAIAVADQVVAVLTAENTQFALGTDRAPFVIESQMPQPGWPVGCRILSASAFAASADALELRIPWLRIDLMSPLFLKESRGEGKKSRAVFNPRFAHLFRACLRTVGRAFVTLGSGSLEQSVDFAALKAAAERVNTQAASWKPFRQRHFSSRRGQRYALEGVVGSAVFADVPAALLPWLVWGGRIGVGEHRVAGAGCWQITIL